MTVPVSHRVHIMPLGYETERVYEPADEYEAEKIILLKHDQGSDPQLQSCIEEIESELNLEPEYKECNLFDLFDALAMFFELISEHEEDDVYVNISTGSKITAVAGMIACMVTDAVPYYVRAKDYGELSIATNVTSIEELPRYHVDAPTFEDIALLNYISKEEPVNKQEILEFGEREDLPFIANRDISSTNSAYPALDNVLDSLEEKGFIDQLQLGRDYQVEITEDGENTLTAFNYLLEKNSD